MSLFKIEIIKGWDIFVVRFLSLILVSLLSTPFFNTIMGAQVFVSNLPFASSEEELAEFFRPYAKPLVVEIIKRNGKSAGYGFVTFASEAEANRAIHATNGLSLSNRILNVAKATSKFPRKKSRRNGEEKNVAANPTKPEESSSKKAPKNGGTGKRPSSSTTASPAASTTKQQEKQSQTKVPFTVPFKSIFYSLIGKCSRGKLPVEVIDIIFQFYRQGTMERAVKRISFPFQPRPSITEAFEKVNGWTLTMYNQLRISVATSMHKIWNNSISNEDLTCGTGLFRALRAWCRYVQELSFFIIGISVKGSELCISFAW